jgi:hypothetical protein
MTKTVLIDLTIDKLKNVLSIINFLTNLIKYQQLMIW